MEVNLENIISSNQFDTFILNCSKEYLETFLMDSYNISIILKADIHIYSYLYQYIDECPGLYLPCMNNKQINNYIYKYLWSDQENMYLMNRIIYYLFRYEKEQILINIAIPYSTYTLRVLQCCVMFGNIKLFRVIVSYIQRNNYYFKDSYYVYSLYESFSCDCSEMSKRQRMRIRKNRAILMYEVLQFIYRMNPKHIQNEMKMNYRYLWSVIVKYPNMKKAAKYLKSLYSQYNIQDEKFLKYKNYIDRKNVKVAYMFNNLPMIKYFHNIFPKEYSYHHLIWVFNNPYINVFRFVSNKLSDKLKELYIRISSYDIKENILSIHIPIRYIRKKLKIWNFMIVKTF